MAVTSVTQAGGWVPGAHRRYSRVIRRSRSDATERPSDACRPHVGTQRRPRSELGHGSRHRHPSWLGESTKKDAMDLDPVE